MQRSARNQRGSALILALIMIVILTFLGFGLISRSLLVTRIAGAERWSTKTFYAADSGVNLARARLRVRELPAFQMTLDDLRGPVGADQTGTIGVDVEQMSILGAPRLAVGSQLGGAQGGPETLYVMFYTTRAVAQEVRTRSESQVSAIMTLGPVPLGIPE